MTDGRRVAGNVHLSLEINQSCKCWPFQMFFLWTPGDPSTAGDLVQNTWPESAHTHLSWRRWVLRAARWGLRGNLRVRRSRGAFSAGGWSGCVEGGGPPSCGCQAQGRLKTQRQKTSVGKTSTNVLYWGVLTAENRAVPSEGAEMKRWPSSKGWEEKGSPKQLEHRTASTTHTHSPTVIWKHREHGASSKKTELMRPLWPSANSVSDKHQSDSRDKCVDQQHIPTVIACQQLHLLHEQQGQLTLQNTSNQILYFSSFSDFSRNKQFWIKWTRPPVFFLTKSVLL